VPKADAQLVRSDVKEALLQAAAELIAEVGWGRVSSRMVAERAGVNNALVHYHFASMEDLLRRAATRVMEQSFAAPTREVWRGGDVVAGMRRALRWLDRLDVDAVDTMVLIEGLVQTRRDADLQRHAAETLGALRTELARSIADGDHHVAAAGRDGVATVLLALLDGLLLHRIIDPTLKLGPAGRSLQVLLAGAESKGGHR
jgi:AcrR family transcriptional regulator